MEMYSVLLREDIYSRPWYFLASSLLTKKIGSGVQLLCMILAVLVLGAVGILNPSYRGGFTSFALFLFVFAGYFHLYFEAYVSRIFSGYLSARLFKQFGGSDWRLNALMVRDFASSLSLDCCAGARDCPWISP
jgi:transmembrane 9 superfamily member 2/4